MVRNDQVLTNECDHRWVLLFCMTNLDFADQKTSRCILWSSVHCAWSERCWCKPKRQMFTIQHDKLVHWIVFNFGKCEAVHSPLYLLPIDQLSNLVRVLAGIWTEQRRLDMFGFCMNRSSYRLTSKYWTWVFRSHRVSVCRRFSSRKTINREMTLIPVNRRKEFINHIETFLFVDVAYRWRLQNNGGSMRWAPSCLKAETKARPAFDEERALRAKRQDNIS